MECPASDDICSVQLLYQRSSEHCRRRDMKVVRARTTLNSIEGCICIYSFIYVTIIIEERGRCCNYILIKIK